MLKHLWARRSRFDACCKKLQLLQSKRGQTAEGDHLLQAAAISIENGDAIAADADLSRYDLIVSDLRSDDRALIHGIRHELVATKTRSIIRAALCWLAGIVFKKLIDMLYRRWFLSICQLSNTTQRMTYYA